MLNLVQAIIKYPPSTGYRAMNKPIPNDNSANKTNLRIDPNKQLAVAGNNQELSSPSVMKAIQSLLSKNSDSMVDLMSSLRAELEDHAPSPKVAKLVDLLTSLTSTNKAGVAVTSESIEQQLKDVIRLLGLDHEQQIVNSEPKRNESIKSLLLQLLEESSFTKTNDKADALLNRITGLQLQSSDSGPITQLLMQIPLYLGQKANDVTIQWSGRKKDDGSIDPDHCRVLFYLDLENMKETTVDLHIQNRVVNIVIFNENERIQDQTNKYISLLKHVLGEMNYHLSQVKFKAPATDQHFSDVSKQTINFKYSGVDFKI